MDIKQVMAVNKDSSFVNPTFAEWSEKDEESKGAGDGRPDPGPIRDQRDLNGQAGDVLQIALPRRSIHFLESVHFHTLADVLACPGQHRADKWRLLCKERLEEKWHQW